MYKLLLISLAAITLLSGCFSESEVEEIKNETVNTVEFYLTNDTERAKKVSYCEENPKMELTPNCINATRAKSKLDRKKMMRG